MLYIIIVMKILWFGSIIHNAASQQLFVAKLPAVQAESTNGPVELVVRVRDHATICQFDQMK